MNTRQPNHNPDSSADLDTLLDAAYTRLVDDLTATFDLDAGAAQATHSATYSALTNDLAQQLDLDAGLAAITGGSLPPPNDTEPHRPASPHMALDHVQDLEHLRFLDAPARLALRTVPGFRGLRDALELGELVAHAATAKHAPAINLDPDLDRALALDRARALARDCALAHDLNPEPGLDQGLANALANALARAYAIENRNDPSDLAIALDLARALALDLARGRDLARDILRAIDVASAIALATANALTPDLARPIGDAFQLALTVTLGLIYHAASCYGRVLGLRLDLGDGDQLDLSAAARARTALAGIGDDFVGADLRSAQMRSDIVGLVGVRWSNDTQWPPEWVDYVRAASDEIEHGIFQITHTDGRRSPTYAAT